MHLYVPVSFIQESLGEKVSVHYEPFSLAMGLRG